MAQRGMRLQRRALHRSVVGPILLLVLGVLLLLGQTGHLDWGRVLSWYSRWWPAILIGTGGLLLLEWFVDQQRQRFTTFEPRVVGPGVGLLLLLLATVGWSLGWFTGETRSRAYSFADQFGLHRWLSQEYEWDDASQSDLPAGWPVTIHNPHGDITVNAASTDGKVHLILHKKAYAWQESSAERLREELKPHFSQADGTLTLEMPSVSGTEADLTVELPAKSPVVLRADRGDTSVTGVQGAVTIFSKSGDVTFNDVTGSVSARVNSDNASVSGRKITGPVRVQGRTGDINLADIDGSLALEGDFFGSTHLEHVSSTVLFQTSRTHFEAARLTGTLDLDGGPDFQADGITGPLVLTTRNRNITLDDVKGGVNIANRNGSVDLTLSSPLGPVQISNERGTIDLALPEKTGFQLSAVTRNGDLENDFGLPIQESGESRSTNGNIAGGGPALHITTSDGGIIIRKRIAASDSKSVPLPPAPPAPPSGGRHLRANPPTLQRM